MLNLPYKPPRQYYDLTSKSDYAIACELKRVQRDVNHLATQVYDLTEQAIVQAYRGK